MRKKKPVPHPLLTEKLALMKRPFMSCTGVYTPEMRKESNRLNKLEGLLWERASRLKEGTPVYFLWGSKDDIREGILQNQVPARKGWDLDMAWIKVPTGACKVWLHEIEEKEGS